MSAQIDSLHFELSFSEAVLRKAQKLYKAGACHLYPSGQLQSYSFQIAEEDVKIKRKQKKLSEAHCTCKNAPLCEHVAAALFYLDEIQLQSPKRKSQNNSIALAFEKQFKTKPELSLQNLLPAQLRQQLLAYLIISEQASFENKQELLAKLQHKIKKQFSGKGNLEDQEFVAAAVKMALRSNEAVAAGAYQFLVPLFLLGKHTVIQRAEIEVLLKKRHYKRFHNDGPDYLEVARLQTVLSTKRQTLADTSAMSSIELLAYCDLLICAGKNDKAKKLLLTVLEKERSQTQLFGSKLLYFAMQCAQRLNDKQVVRAVLLQRLRESVQADAAVIEQLREITPLLEFKTLILKLALQTNDMYAEKKAALLITAGDRKAIIDFARVVPLRYNLLLNLLHEALPLVPSNCVELVAKNTVLAIRQSARLEWQTQVINQCELYLTALSLAQRKQIIEKIQANLGERSHIALQLQSRLD